MRKSIGPRTLPCGTPQDRKHLDDTSVQCWQHGCAHARLIQPTTKQNPAHNKRPLQCLNEDVVHDLLCRKQRGLTCRVDSLRLVFRCMYDVARRLHSCAPSIKTAVSVECFFLQADRDTWQKLMTLKNPKLVTNKLFHNLGHESKVRHCPVVLHVRCFHSCFLKPWSNYSMALTERKTTLLWRRVNALYRPVMNCSSSGRHFFKMSVGRRSSEHDLDDDPMMTALTSLAMQSWKWSNIAVAGVNSVVTLSPAVAFSAVTFNSKSQRTVELSGSFSAVCSCHWLSSALRER